MTIDDINEKQKQYSINEPHPILGKYLSHHPSNRIRLMIRAGIFYAIPVLILQALFWNVDTDTASRFLPILFGIAGLPATWYAAHFWNREVILYEKGFTYRQGSQIGHFTYAEIIQLQPDVRQSGILGFFQQSYNYTLMTSNEETLRISNLYSDTNKLVTRLESYIARDRLPLIQQSINENKTVDVGGGLHLNQMGLDYEGRELFWHEVGTRNVKDGQLIIRKHDNSEWAKIPISDFSNPVLLLALLKQNINTTG